MQPAREGPVADLRLTELEAEKQSFDPSRFRLSSPSMLLKHLPPRSAVGGAWCVVFVDQRSIEFLRGSDTFTEGLLTMRRLVDFVPTSHPLRPIRVMAKRCAGQDERAVLADVRDRRQGRPTRHLAGGGQGPVQRTR
jgi:hypothetical protein